MPADLPRLLQPEELTAAIARHRAEGGDVLLVDLCRGDVHAAGHIEGAVHVEPAELVAGTPPGVGKLPDAARIDALVARLGLTHATWVIAYDDEGGGWAGRFLWTLAMLGHDTWSYLDGGLHAWVDAGGALSTDHATHAPVPGAARLVLAPDARPRIHIDELLRRHAEAGLQVWDARSAAEHRGERTGSARAGRVPGAINIDWLELMDPRRAYRLRTDLPALLQARGLRRDSEIVTHCQSHHRSGLSWLVGRLLGLDIRAYDGSWSEWGNRSDTPVEAS